jgi:hypothetical protein
MVDDGATSDTKLLYFPLKQFSPRFGPTFFTFQITDFSKKVVDDGICSMCRGKEVIFYDIEVRRGRKQWKIQRRYSDFLSLTIILNSSELQKMKSITPPRTIFYITNDREFLEARRKDLEAFLEGYLRVLAEEDTDLSQNLTVLEFFGLKDDH